jgi:hypothetical protein
MKTKLLPSCLRLAWTVGLAALALAPLHAGEDGTTATVKLSAPDKPAILRIDLPWADIHITGVSGDSVTVESSLERKGAKETREDGLRRLDDECSFELSEHNNVVSLTLDGDNPAAGGNSADFKISVPRAMALDVRTEAGGDLEVRDIAGDIEIENMNGGVRLEGIAGSAVVNTMNGEVRASYAKAPSKLVSITSMNGEIDLRVPADTKANVRLRTTNGSILTDFDEATLKTKSEGTGYGSIGPDVARSVADAVRVGVQIAREVQRGVEQVAREADAADTSSPDVADTPREPRVPRPPRPPHPPVAPFTGGKVVSGTLNGGGVDVQISTMNGKITLRQTGQSGPAPAADPQTAGNVTVTFQDPDKFTDAGDSRSSGTSTAVLDALRDYVQQTAAPLLPAGSKLTVTFLDLDLAGTTRTGRDDIRVMTDSTFPRAHLKFQLTDADGRVLKEGERKLINLDYLQSTEIIGRNDSLFYDKQLLKGWIVKEFRKHS